MIQLNVYMGVDQGWTGPDQLDFPGSQSKLAGVLFS